MFPILVCGFYHDLMMYIITAVNIKKILK